MSRWDVLDPNEYFEGQLLGFVTPPYDWELDEQGD